MQVPLVMTIIGPDRTGLVEAVARTVAHHGGNWLESRMCRLGGQFAGILRITLPSANRPALLAALAQLQADGLQILLREDGAAPAPGGRQVKLELVGADRTGIVREITHALAAAGVNVEEFSSEVASAPMSGESLFTASIRVQLPPDCDLKALRTALEKTAADLLVDVSLAEVSGA
jgi:glycine cleavage system regulatory protein